jgi:CRISPR-associated protein Cmr3
MTLELEPFPTLATQQTCLFQYLISIEPLGFLYGSTGRFLSPENLVGRSGTHFPPSAATLSGLFAAHYAQQLENNPERLREILHPLCLAGPFWAYRDNAQNFYVPTPFNCLVKNNTIHYLMGWQEGKWQVWQPDKNSWETPPNDKFDRGTWLAVDRWQDLHPHQPQRFRAIELQPQPWKFNPHLHPRLKDAERCVDSDRPNRDSLFLENAVQLDPDVCLVYLSNTLLLKPGMSGWYRFGGEGHLANVRCEVLSPATQILLSQKAAQRFAIVTSAVWGSNRLSYRTPAASQSDWEDNLPWSADCKVEAMLTERPFPFRYRMGGQGTGRRLSRGRYAVPAGTVYVADRPLPAWQEWPEDWFATESRDANKQINFTTKRWGCGLALPLASTAEFVQ